jgi:pantoate--beta-alanine ligase
MGALHAGHLSLVELARRHAPAVAVSIFVNPTQFGPREDFNKYPRPIESDLRLCEEAGVDLVFHPSVEAMYPAPPAPPLDLMIDLPALSAVLEGKHRPGHFRGVCQVVAKLFNILQPQAACFGEKDYQQLRILTAMTEAMNFPIDIVPGPTLRDPDGLAMSSRNRYLSHEERQRALAISRGLFAARDQFTAGIDQTNRLLTTIQHTLLEQHLAIDYVAAVDIFNLKPIERITGPTLLAVAARAGSTRLIDNVVVGR